MSTKTKKTLAAILERDAEKISALKAEMYKAREKLNQLEQQAGLKQARKTLENATQAYRKAIHYNELEQDVVEKLQEDHQIQGHERGERGLHKHCRECGYVPDSDYMEEYLVENAEDFEVEAADEPTEAATA